MYDVITVGSATVDVFVYTDRSEIVKITGKKSEEELIAYPSGSKIAVKNLNISVGGGGTNVAVSLKRLGSKVAYLGNIGNDENAGVVLNLLKKEGIGFIGTRGKELTSYSVILDSIEHDRTILTYRGASNNLQYSKINKKRLKARWFYFSSMLGESYNALEKLADFAKKRNIKLAFNPSSYLAEKGAAFLKNILEKTYLLVLNDEEAAMLVGEGSTEELLKRLIKLGPSVVVVTKGKNGAEATDGNRHYISESHDIKVVESTGAGDAFASAFLAGIIKKNDIRFAMQLGAANAESVLSEYGAKNRLLTWKEAIVSIRKQPAKVDVKKL